MRLEFPILFMTATLCGPGGVRAVIAEHLLLKQQLLVLHVVQHVSQPNSPQGAAGASMQLCVSNS